MDILSPLQRSERMALIRSKSTKTEVLVRRSIYAMGFRYRLHVKSLPGTPDIVFKRMRKIIFVNGCFWHGHTHCKKARMPKSRLDYWVPKIRRNQERDALMVKSLKKENWKVLVIWECQLADATRLTRRLKKFLSH